MKPHENEPLSIRRAITTHEDAAAAVADLIENNPDPVYDEVMRRLEQNIEALRAREGGGA